MQAFFKTVIEELLPFWKVTKRVYYTTYYSDVERVHRLTGRTQIVNKDLDWELTE